MDISIAKDEYPYENRVALTPAAVKSLVRSEHNVYIETGAGIGAGFSDEMFRDVGAKIVFSKDEAYMRGKILLKIFPPTLDEYKLLTRNQIIFSFLHLAAAHEEGLKILLQKETTAIGLEVIEDKMGNLPVLTPMSELAGQMVIPIASHYLSNMGGGRGILLGGAAGIPPATVVVLGAGTVGLNAVRSAVGLGSHVILFDASLERLRYASDILNRQIVTYLPFRYNLEKVIPIADVVIGAILIPGVETPKLVPTELVQQMKPGSVILDVSVDQGGCVETTHPTNWANPSYILHDVTHFCVPNMPSNVGRTATYALANAALRYIRLVADIGPEKAFAENRGLARGVYTFKGNVTNEAVGKRFQIKSVPLSDLMKGGAQK
jgi:alanine dehydrogenase